MAIICPKCGREFLGQRDTCPVCGCATVDDSGIDNSEAARKQRLQKLQEQKLARAMEQARQPQVREEQLQTEPVQPRRTTQNGVSGLGIAALILSLFGCLTFVGTILAIVDLCIKDGKKKVCSIIALIITCLWCLFTVLIILIGSDSNKPKAVTNRVENQVSKQQNQEPDIQAEAPVKDTFGLMETAEMNNVQVTMTNYVENYGSEWNQPTDGNVFVLVEFEIANNSNSELAVSSLISFDGYVDGYSASTSFGALMENEQSQLDGTIAPGMKMRGWIGYEVSAGWRELEIHFTDNVWSNNKFKFLLQK